MSSFVKYFITAIAISSVLVIAPGFASADTTGTTGFGNTGAYTGGSTGFGNTTGVTGGVNTSNTNNGSGPSTCGNGPCVVGNPLGSTTSLCGLLKVLFQAAVAILTPIAVLFIIWSGFQFVLAQGNPDGLKKARQNFYYTIIGIAIFLGAWLIATVIASTVNAVGGSNIISCQ